MTKIEVKCIFLLAILIGIVLAERRYIKGITENQIRSLGESVTLTCNVDNPDGYNVLWVKKNRDRLIEPAILSMQGILSFKDPRFNLTLQGNSYILNISNIELADNAIYECQVVTSANSKETAQVELLLRRPPIITGSIEINPSPVSIGKKAILKCSADGYPHPIIRWSRDNDDVMPAGGQFKVGNDLHIENVAKEDRGLYICTADNGEGKPDKRSVNFEVEFAPTITVPRPKVAQALDYDIELECRVEAYPAPTVVWFKDGRQIYDDSDYTVFNTATINEITTSILRIKTVEPQQFGDYVCKANNKVGSASERLNVFEQAYPNINFQGLQWNRSSSVFNRIQFTLNYIVIIIFSVIFK